jgi:hypothetical protein
MRIPTAVTICALVAVAACDKKPSSDSAASSASAGSTLSSISYSKKPPGRGSRPVTQKAFMGGQGATLPSAQSLRTPEPSTDRQMRHRAQASADCSKLPDNAAECDGKTMYFCDDQQLWMVDCDAEAKFSGVTSGSCFEGEKFVDCLGCTTADDGSQACCDFEMTVCCTPQGDCYSPK